MKGYKGFKKDLTCMGFKFEEGKTYRIDGAITLCEKGFHFCQNPFDVVDYYDITDSEFAEVEAGETKTEGNKTVTSEIKIGVRLGLKGWINACVDYAIKHVKLGDNVQSSSGDYSKLAASGYSSKLAASGYSSKLAASGDCSELAASGDCSKLAACGDCSQLAASGYSSKLAACGDYSVVAGVGVDNMAKAAKGCWIVLAEWVIADNKPMPKYVKSVKVDGEKIKANTWYKLKNGKFVVAK